MTDLYRHFDASGRLLYVGISLSALVRLVAHRNASEWFDEIAYITIDKFDKRADALECERKAIREENPIYNRKVALNPLPKRINNGTLLTTAEFSAIVGLSVNTILTRLKNGTLAIQPIGGLKPYRWRRADVDAFSEAS